MTPDLQEAWEQLRALMSEIRSIKADGDFITIDAYRRVFRPMVGEYQHARAGAKISLKYWQHATPEKIVEYLNSRLDKAVQYLLEQDEE